MKKSIVAGSVFLVASLFAVQAAAAQKDEKAEKGGKSEKVEKNDKMEKSDKGDKAKKSGAAVFVTADELKWADVPGFQGIKTAAAEGAMDKGPHHMFMKFTPGFSAPMHHHSANHHVAVIAGTMVLTADGKEHRLGPGSYFSFTDKLPHTTKCDVGADCVIFMDVREKWDVVPEEPAKAEPKK